MAHVVLRNDKEHGGLQLIIDGRDVSMDVLARKFRLVCDKCEITMPPSDDFHALLTVAYPVDTLDVDIENSAVEKIAADEPGQDSDR